MDRDPILSKRTAGHISFIAVLLILGISLPLENCFENYKPITLDQVKQKDISVQPTIQQSLKSDESSELAYLHLNNGLSASLNSKTSSINKAQAQQIQHQTSTPHQKSEPSITTPSGHLPTLITESMGEAETTVASSRNEKQQSTQGENLLAQNKALQITIQADQKQREPKEQTLQEKEDQLINKIFRTREGYTVKLYKEATIWKANVVEEIGIFRREFDLPAYLGKDEILF